MVFPCRGAKKITAVRRDSMCPVTPPDGCGAARRLLAELCVLALFELLLDCFETEVYSLLEAIGSLGSHGLALGEGYFHNGFLVHCGLWLHYGELHVDSRDSRVVACEAFGFLVDECNQAFACVEVDGLNSNVHS